MDCSNKVELVEGHSRSGAEWSRANKAEKVEVKIVQKSPANIFSLSDFVFYCSLAPSLPPPWHYFYQMNVWFGRQGLCRQSSDCAVQCSVRVIHSRQWSPFTNIFSQFIKIGRRNQSISGGSQYKNCNQMISNKSLI